MSLDAIQHTQRSILNAAFVYADACQSDRKEGPASEAALKALQSAVAALAAPPLPRVAPTALNKAELMALLRCVLHECVIPSVYQREIIDSFRAALPSDGQATIEPAAPRLTDDQVWKLYNAAQQSAQAFSAELDALLAHSTESADRAVQIEGPPPAAI